MTDNLIQYQPDESRAKRLIPSPNAPPVTVDKPVRGIRMRVMSTRAPTHTKHYPRKTPTRRRKYDRRNVRFF